MIDRKNFFDQIVKNDRIIYNNIKKISIRLQLSIRLIKVNCEQLYSNLKYHWPLFSFM